MVGNYSKEGDWQMIRKCPVCGRAFETDGRKVYCSNKCQWTKRNRKRSIKSGLPIGIAPDPVKDCPNDCKYLLIEPIKHCNYLLTEGKPRGCAGNKNCKRYTK